MNEKIKELQSQIERERQKVKDCNHEYGKPYFNPEKTREPYGYKLVGKGSDVWGEPEGYRDVEKPRWTRKCSKCGHEQHTYNEKPIVSGHEPDFK